MNDVKRKMGEKGRKKMNDGRRKMGEKGRKK